ncbi:MAG: methionine--tRNA ligase [Rhodospirillales bacterium]|nr:methionine--tRNA ligase [Alphaproteobacteria bacterium]MCB9987609.1 methionine--tRNA ligase [Rhodospirillales bacterium]USO07676.1 MAG: methionine--tRNA ligase [Rhodospirillales bacterium]
MTGNKTFYITTPIYYVNGDPHMGHAYTTIACDVMARFKRLDGFDVHFLTGTDEHGIKVRQAADAAGVAPQTFTDQVSQAFRDVLPALNIANDDFIRTTSARHKQGVQALWRAIAAAGDIYKGGYSGWYAVRDEAYYAEDETELRADGKRYALASGAECTWMEEESYFFKLSAWGDRLLKFYAENPEFIGPESSRNEVISFVKSGLKDLSISRTTFDWGIKVPGDDRHVMYVWIDALANYITALGYGQDDDSLFKKFWPADVHVVGKEITRFHCVYWPAFLMSAGIVPPKRVYANGWWIMEGQKMSKSLGNVVTPADLIERYGIDGARYVLLRDLPFGNDGNFVHDNAVARLNADLSNGLGNLAQRTLSMIQKNCDAQVPQPGAFDADDNAMLAAVQTGLLPDLRREFDGFKFSRALDRIMEVTAAANQYVDRQAPWKLKKEDPARMATVLYVLAESVRGLALAIQPFIPVASGKLLDQLAVPENARDFAHIAASHALKPGTPLPEPQGVFPRLETKAAA